jgi:hypothetical protein
MDANKLRFYDLLKKERQAAKVLVEALLEIHGKCKNPNGEEKGDKHDCAHCVFEIGRNCGKLFLDHWLTVLMKE